MASPPDRHDSPLLRPTLSRPGPASTPNTVSAGVCPSRAPWHLDAGYDSTKTHDLLHDRRCESAINQQGSPLPTGARWVVERTKSWHNRGCKKLAVCPERHTRIIDTLIALANAIITTRRLIRIAWTTQRWATLTQPPTMTNPRDL